MTEDNFSGDDRALLQRIDERQKTLFNNMERNEKECRERDDRLDKRVGRIEIFLGSIVVGVAMYGLAVIAGILGLPSP